MDVDDIKDDVDCSDDSDIDLEAELAAIGGGSKPHRPRKPAPVPSGDLNAMIAASLRDVPSDDEASGKSFIILLFIYPFINYIKLREEF